MKNTLKLALLASSLAGMAMITSSDARSRWHDDRYNSISTSAATGGYCDTAGCPDHFWRYPIHYGPVFVHGRWFRGPVYFRGDRWAREYWVRGGWHRDEWHGPRPYWARASHDGPPLAFEYYRDHGFDLGDHWRREHDADNGGRDWNGDRHDQGGGDWHHDHGGDGQGGYNGGDHGAGWQGGYNGGGDRHSGGSGVQNHGDWHTAGGDTGGGRSWDNHWQAGNGLGDQHGANGNGQGGDHGGQSPAGNVIHVTAATYGAICRQPAGNVTKPLAAACDGKSTCDYVVQYQVIGDPAPGCAKDFSVQWTCSAGPGGSATVPPEAGLGGKVSLQCSNPRP